MNRQQIEWIFNHVERITNKYLAIFPLNDSQWMELHDELNVIFEDSKHHKKVEEILLEVMNYFSRLDALYRRANK